MNSIRLLAAVVAIAAFCCDAIAQTVTFSRLNTNHFASTNFIVSLKDPPLVGPASSTDNAIVRFDGATGKLLQNSSVTTVDDAGLIKVAATGHSDPYFAGTTTNGYKFLAAPTGLFVADAAENIVSATNFYGGLGIENAVIALSRTYPSVAQGGSGSGASTLWLESVSGNIVNVLASVSEQAYSEDVAGNSYYEKRILLNHTNSQNTQLNTYFDLSGPPTASLMTFKRNSASVWEQLQNGTLRVGVTNSAAATPSFSWYGDTDTGMYRSAADTINFSTGSTLRGTINSSGYTSSAALIAGTYVQAASGSYLNIGTDAPVYRDAAATWQWGVDAASPIAQKLKAHDGSGTDKSGADMTIAAGIGTGTASGGSLYLQTGGVGGASGSSLNTLTNRWQISPTGNLLAATDSLYTIGAAGANRPSYIYCAGGANFGGRVDTANGFQSNAGNNGFFGVANRFFLLPTTIDGEARFTDNLGTAFSTLYLGATSATPSNTALRSGSGSGADKDGGNLTVSGGQSTGTGRGGSVITQTSLTGTTGSSANSYSTREYHNAKPVTLTESAATTIATVAVAAGEYVSFDMYATVFASDGTDHQALPTRLNVSAVNKAGTVDAKITAIDGLTAGAVGTLTCTYTAAASGNNVIVQANAVSSLTQTVLNAKWSINALNGNGTAAVTVP